MGLDKTQTEFIEQLYHEMCHSLSTYAISTLNNRSLVEEAVQDTFMIASAKIDDMTSSSNPKGWLVKTLKNVIRNMNRNRARLNNHMVSFLAFDESAASASTDDAGSSMIYMDLIGSEDFELLKRIVLDKYSMIEAAEELNISVEACKKRVQRAKKKLQDTLCSSV